MSGQEQILKYHRFESPITTIACPSQFIPVGAMKIALEKNNGDLKSLTSETKRRDRWREKWVLLSLKQNPYQKNCPEVKVKPISLYSGLTIYTDWREFILNMGHLENGCIPVMNHKIYLSNLIRKSTLLKWQSGDFFKKKNHSYYLIIIHIHIKQKINHLKACFLRKLII